MGSWSPLLIDLSSFYSIKLFYFYYKTLVAIMLYGTYFFCYIILLHKLISQLYSFLETIKNYNLCYIRLLLTCTILRVILFPKILVDGDFVKNTDKY